MNRLGPALLVVLFVVACGSGPSVLTQEQVKAAETMLAGRGLSLPKSMSVNDVGFVVADYELSDAEVSSARPLQRFAEARLLAIREALLPHGFKNYRVNINGTPPGTGLTRRYGSARYVDGGALEWVTP